MPGTVDQASSLVPDARALAAGEKTTDPRAWTGLGQSVAAFWGECKGSATYQVRVGTAEANGTVTLYSEGQSPSFAGERA